ncbi:PLP-dependent transferase [Cylindrobasidium torrendii FP15055 ss-10]|uniref:PLP-dependent transferase n=1 Tax=Cylindrobasidium torrendii FP15055 ss-10 TaxID=1314674 RepID=A0A0D7BU93_9AGAR|nr:PLP-dependent transferase [Cylindrobasidium torrendii FP15055 ss-10]
MSTHSEKYGGSIDLSHHLSDVAKNRELSPLKGLQKYMQKPGIISMAGGTPPTDYFPFAKLSGDLLVHDSFPLSSSSSSTSFSWLWKLFGVADKTKTDTVSVSKLPDVPGGLSLAALLQYGPATGDPHLAKAIREFSANVYQPAYSDWTTLVSVGNTEGWARVVQTLFNPGEGFLVSEWTYPSALAGARPYNLKPVPIGMDGEGMSAISLREVLEGWDESARGIKRPHVMYTVPVGQNPTGATMGAERKKAIYDICVEYDIIIVEDDPYYFLQQGEYVPRDARVDSREEHDAEKFIASLAPSFVKFDYQGRVIRLDTFSKTIAPGCRLGWFTCNPLFAERLERAGETTTQSPCGFGQAMVASLLTHWQYDGYIRWLQALRLQYKHRRDFLIDSLADEFHLDLSIGTSGFRNGSQVYNVSFKRASAFSEKHSAQDGRPIFSFVPPSSGMFVWLKLHLEDFVPPGSPSAKIGIKQLETNLWVAVAEAGVLLGPGLYFSATPVTDDMHGDGHFRLSFSSTTEEDFKRAAKLLSTTFRKFIKDL